MKKKGLTLLLTLVFFTGYLVPLPECFLTKMNCPRRGTGTCEVFAGQCESMESSCGERCPLSQACKEQQSAQTRYELLKKLKFYPVRLLVKRLPDFDSGLVLTAAMGLSGSYSLQEPALSTSAVSCERASPIFIRIQSFLI